MSPEELFQLLIEATEALQSFFKHSLQNDDFKEVDRLLAERESMLLQLREALQQTADPGKYQSLYQLWQEKDAEIIQFIHNSMNELGKKLKEVQYVRTTSNQYDSYLRQMPFGAFVDKKK